jgi:Holliday junction resolvasome RuvABC endonuclease subunit
VTKVLRGISFDMSRKSTGFAYWMNDEPKRVGTITLPAGFLGEQLSKWDAAVQGRILGVNWVAFEDARAVSKQHGMILFGMTGILHKWCWELGIPILGFAQTTVKKALTGSGKAKKDEMLACARERWPDLGVANDDEADALGVGLAFWATQN